MTNAWQYYDWREFAPNQEMLARDDAGMKQPATALEREMMWRQLLRIESSTAERCIEIRKYLERHRPEPNLLVIAPIDSAGRLGFPTEIQK